MNSIIRYVTVSALIFVALLGIPLVWPTKQNPYTGKSIANKASLELKA